MVRTTRDNTAPVCIEKRYSEFEKLNATLKKYFPAVMSDVHFPRKQFSGNFSAKTIAERSRAFEQYLSQLIMNPQVRMSDLFAPFFYGTEWSKACELFRSDNYPAAILILRRVLDLQRKLLADAHSNTVRTLSLLAVCYMKCCNDVQSYLSARLAIKSIHTNDRSEYLLPLLEYSIRLAWTLGYEKQDLEERLKSLKKGPNDQPHSLEDIVVRHIQGAV